jgi:hypothetical protein
MMNRVSRLVQLYGDTNPTLYFLLLDSKEKEAVRSDFKDDIKDFSCSSEDQRLMLDFLSLFYEIKSEGEVRIQASTNSPISLNIEIEQGMGDMVPIATVTISNRGDKGRYVLNSPSAMDYIVIERTDGVSIPKAQRDAPVVPLYLNPGEVFTKRCALNFNKTTKLNQRSWKNKYPLKSNYSGWPGGLHTFFSGTNIPYTELNGDIIGFGNFFVPVQIFAEYDEEKLCKRVVANSFDKHRMPWFRWNSQTAIQFKQRAMSAEGQPVKSPPHKWYSDLIYTQSNKIGIPTSTWTLP